MAGKLWRSTLPDKIRIQRAEAYYRPCDLSPRYSDCGCMRDVGAVKPNVSRLYRLRG